MRIRFLAIGLIAGFLTACTGGGADPKPTPSSSAVGRTSTGPSSSSSPTRTGPLTTGPNVRPGEKPPVYPDLAKQHNANGALAFAAYYFRAFDWGYATNDPYLVREASEPSCSGCKKYIEGLEALRRSNGTLKGGRITIQSRGLRTGHFNYKSDFVVEVVVDETPVVVAYPTSPPTTAAPKVTGYHQFIFISWNAGRWRVVEVASDK